MRLYDKALVAKIHANQFTKEVDGIPVLFKPVPDAEPAHLDPRLREIIIKKRTMFANRAKAGWTLSSERYRPDKVTYDLIETPVDCTEQLIPIGGHKIDIYIYRTANIQPNAPVLVYLHGGGFTAGDIHLFGKQMQYIAEQSGAVVVFPEYRLAPENPFPAPVEDAWGTVQWVHAHAAELGADPAKLMVAGDSAGGSLTNACVLQDEKGIIRKIMGIYPSWDSSDYHEQTAYTWSYDAYEVADEDKKLAYSRIDRIKSGVDKDPDSSNSLYLQGHTTSHDPLVSAVFATDEQLKKFPETVIVAAEYDYLRVGSAKRLASLGVPVRSIRYCGCDHGFLDMLGTIVQSEELCLTIADVLEGLRTSGILDPAEVETAIVEANGAINAFPYASKRPPTADEMNVDPGYEGLPMTLIMDGRIQTGNLGTAQLDQTQLEQMLSSRRLAAESVFFCSLDTQGRMMIQDRAGNVTQFQAIDPGEVKW